MNNIIYVQFGKKKETEKYSADVYSYDMKKYQFHTTATSINDAYYHMVEQAFECGVSVIQCIAIYSGFIDDRNVEQMPIKVWKQDNPLVGSLVEY